MDSMGTPRTVIDCVERTDNYAKFVIEPLERGFGTNLGNSLRRVLLSSLTGAAVTWVKIKGVQHEYASVASMKENVTEFLLNVKGIRLKPEFEGSLQLRLEANGEGVVCAGDIQSSAEFGVVNPDHHLATLDSKEATLSVELNVEAGKGYVPATFEEGLSIGVLPVDAVFTPLRKVNYRVERTRVGQQTDYDRLILDVWTDGSLTPAEAVRQAAQILVDHFFRFCAIDKEVEIGQERQPLALTVPAEKYNTLVEKLDLSARTFNALKRTNINKVGEILERTKDELLAIRNFGDKSLTELYERLSAMGYLPQGIPEEQENDSQILEEELVGSDEGEDKAG